MKAGVSAALMVDRREGAPVAVTGLSQRPMRQRWNDVRRRPAGPKRPHSRRTPAALPPHRSARGAATAITCRAPTASRHTAARPSHICSPSAANHPPTILRRAGCRPFRSKSDRPNKSGSHSACRVARDHRRATRHHRQSRRLLTARMAKARSQRQSPQSRQADPDTRAQRHQAVCSVGRNRRSRQPPHSTP